MNVLFKES